LSAFLVDTNVLVYAYDPRDRKKQEHSRAVLDRLVSRELAVISVQCLTEFFRVVRWKLPNPLRPDDALSQVVRLARACRVLDLTAWTVLEACRASNTYQVSIWDALIWASAKVNQISDVLTEDWNHERVLEGVRFLNPFDPAFDLAVLGARR
jgi:predicted nucleic acid-binding protein